VLSGELAAVPGLSYPHDFRRLVFEVVLNWPDLVGCSSPVLAARGQHLPGCGRLLAALGRG
jgi:hypothetical protein